MPEFSYQTLPQAGADHPPAVPCGPAPDEHR